MMKPPIYFDYAATTPIDPRVVEKMMPYLAGDFGNPASAHFFGQQAKKAIDQAREQVASLIHADPAEIIWTSGATESNNLALKGAAQLYQRKGKHIVTIKTEHPSVLETCQQLEKEGFNLTYLSPEKNGLVSLEKFEAALRPDTFLASIMHVNNETGVIQDIAKFSKLTRSHDVLLHVDAVQSAGKLAIDVNAIEVDLMSITAHKVYGPKGIGALYVRRKPRVRVAPQILGGGQEQGMRSGTLAVQQIVGLGEAFSIAKHEIIADQNKMIQLRDVFWQGVRSLDTIFLNSDFDVCIPNIINLGFRRCAAQNIIDRMPEVAFSSGSACQSKGIEPSYVLRAMGLNYDDAKSSMRVSFGRFTTLDQIECLIKSFTQAAKKQFE